MLVKFKIKLSCFRQLQNLIISNFSLLPGRPSKCYEFCGFPFRQNTSFCLCFCPAAGRPPAPANFDCKKFLKNEFRQRNFLNGVQNYKNCKSGPEIRVPARPRAAQKRNSSTTGGGEGSRSRRTKSHTRTTEQQKWDKDPSTTQKKGGLSAGFVVRPRGLEHGQYIKLILAQRPSSLPVKGVLNKIISNKITNKPHLPSAPRSGRRTLVPWPVRHMPEL